MNTKQRLTGKSLVSIAYLSLVKGLRSTRLVEQSSSGREIMESVSCKKHEFREV